MSDSFDWPDNYPDPTEHKKQRVHRRVMFLLAVMLLCCAGGILVGMFVQSAWMSNNKEDTQVESRGTAVPQTITSLPLTSDRKSVV